MSDTFLPASPFIGFTALGVSPGISCRRRNPFGALIGRSRDPKFVKMRFPLRCEAPRAVGQLLSGVPALLFSPCQMGATEPPPLESPCEERSLFQRGTRCPGGTAGLSVSLPKCPFSVGGAVPWHAGPEGDGADRKLVMCWRGFNFIHGLQKQRSALRAGNTGAQ